MTVSIANDQSLRIDINNRISFNVFLSVAAVVGNLSGYEIDIILDDTGSQRGRKEFRERAFSGLIRSQSRYQASRLKAGTSIVPVANGAP
jgi:hypothetical protein